MAVSVVTVEEQIRGWLAEIQRHADPQREISPYAKLQRQIEVFAQWIILPLEIESAELFSRFRKQGVRIGSLDLKIACIVLAHGATLLTRNSTDFGKVPGMRVENWLQ